MAITTYISDLAEILTITIQRQPLADFAINIQQMPVMHRAGRRHLARLCAERTSNALGIANTPGALHTKAIEALHLNEKF